MKPRASDLKQLREDGFMAVLQHQQLTISKVDQLVIVLQLNTQCLVSIIQKEFWNLMINNMDWCINPRVCVRLLTKECGSVLLVRIARADGMGSSDCDW